MSLLFKNSVVSILKDNGTKVGTGFFVSDNLIVTCAHVVALAGEIPQIQIGGSNTKLTSTLIPEYYRESNNGDIAFLHVENVPDVVQPLKLGKAEHSLSGNSFQTFGYPYVGDGFDGINARGEILGLTKENNQQLIQLRSPELDLGHSGSPVLDESRGVVIGMIVSVYKSNTDSKLRDTAFAIPTELLWQVCSEIQPSETSPYLGLATFTEETERFFFGRETLTKKLLDSLRGGNRFLAIFGSSGSGKSSLVRGGLLPALKKGQLPNSHKWAQFTMRPADDPYNQLEASGFNLFDMGVFFSVNDDIESVVLFIDQFEELFTSCPDDLTERFVNDLAMALENPKLILVLAMRDDFYSVFNAKAVALAVSEHLKVENVPWTLKDDEIMAMIELPAKEVNLSLVDGLADIIIRDLKRGGDARSATLPLLEFALTQLWEKRRDGFLTYEAYLSIGGVTGSLARWADNAYSGLPKADQPLAESFFTSLIHLGDEAQGFPDTRQRRLVADFEKLNSFPRMIKYFADHRLIITSGEGIELVHDALIREWSRLQNWIRNNRRNLRIREGVSEAARQWENAGRHDETLLVHRGGRLEDALSLFDKLDTNPTLAEKAYLSACKTLRNRDIQRQRRIVIASISAAILFFILGSLAWQNSQISKSQTLSAQAQLELSGSFPERGPILSLKALEKYPYTPQAEQALASAVWESRVRAIIPNYEDFIPSFSPNGKYFLTISSNGNTLLLMDRSSYQVIQEYVGHTNTITSAKFNKDGTSIISIANDSTIRVWDTSNGKEIGLANTLGVPSMMTISSDGVSLAVMEIDNEITLWHIGEDGQPLQQDRIPDSFNMNQIVFSPNGASIAGVGDDGYARIWELRAIDISNPMIFEHGKKVKVTALAFSPDGETLVTGGADQFTREWDINSGNLKREILWRSEISSVQFNATGSKMVIGDWTGVIRIVDVGSGNEVLTLKSHNFYSNFGTTTMPVIYAEFNPVDDNQILSTGYDSSIRLWDAAVIKNPIIVDLNSIYEISFNFDHSLAVFMPGDNTARLINVASGNDLQVLPYSELSDVDYGTPIVITHKGDKIVLFHSFSLSDSIEVFDAQNGEKITTISGLISGTSPVAINYSDTMIAATSIDDKYILFFDINSGQILRQIELPESIWANELVFSPDDRWLLVIGWQTLVIDLKGSQPLRILDDASTNIASFSSDNNRLVTIHSEGELNQIVKVWDVASWSKLVEWSTGSHITSANLSPNGDRVIVGGSDGKISVWDAVLGKKLYELKAHDDRVQFVAFDLNGTTLLSVGSSEDGTIKRWRIWSGTETLIEYAKRCCEVRSIYPDERIEFGLYWDLSLKDLSGRQSSSAAVIFFTIIGIFIIILFVLAKFSFKHIKSLVNSTSRPRRWGGLFTLSLVGTFLMALIGCITVILLLWIDPSRDEALIIIVFAVSLPFILLGYWYGVLTYHWRRSLAFIRTVSSSTLIGLLGGLLGGAIGGAIAFTLFQNVPVNLHGVFLQGIFQDNAFDPPQYTSQALMFTTSAAFAILIGLFAGVTGLLGGVFSSIHVRSYNSRMANLSK